MADFLDKRVFLLKECEFFFLDEADRMLDMGFRWAQFSSVQSLLQLFSFFSEKFQNKSQKAKKLETFAHGSMKETFRFAAKFPLFHDFF